MPKVAQQFKIGDKVCVFPGLRSYSPDVCIRPAEICEVVELPSGKQPADAVAIRRLRGEVVWVDRDMLGRAEGCSRRNAAVKEPMRRSRTPPVRMAALRDADFCQSLLMAIASASCDNSWAVAVIHPAELLLLWDSRPGATLANVKASAGTVGQVIDASTVAAGPGSGAVVGVLVRPRGRDLDGAAESLQRARD